MRLFLLIILIYFNLFLGFSQSENSNWCFSYNNKLIFNKNYVIKDTCYFGFNESSSSISDKNGNLLFYSNGITLYNKYNKIVKNGQNLGFPISNNETSSFLGSLLLMHPKNDSIVYLFSTDYNGRSGGLTYSIIHVKKNNDSGEVIVKKVNLLNSINESIISINHQNNNDIWICCHSFGNNLFYNFLITKNSIIRCNIVNKIGFFHGQFSGSGAQVPLKFSNNSKYIVHNSLISGNIEILKFDNSKGKIYDTVFSLINKNVYSYEFSQNSNFIYFNYIDSITQFDLKSGKEIKIYTPTNSQRIVQLQVAIDGKIYGSIINEKDLFIINNPNNEGLNCNPILELNFLKYNSSGYLPNFNQSYFYTPSINYSYEMNCINNSIQFEGYDTFSAVTHQWQTKKLYSVNNYTSIGNTKNITHPFADTGTYLVRYIADNGNRKDTVEKTITVYPKIKKDFLGKDTTIAQGSLFNIQLKSPQPSHCQEWHFERLNTQINKGSTNNIVADSIGKYICKTTNQAFCEVIDTIIINECINNLTVPSIYRNLTDTLFTYQPLADSFVWYKNNQQIAITKQPFIKVKDTGTYRVEAAKKEHCNRSSNTFYINKLGVKHYTLNDFNIKVYPNPSNGIINIESEKQNKLKITDLIGRTILETENQKQLELVKGVYYFMFEVDEYIITEKVIVL